MKGAELAAEVTLPAVSMAVDGSSTSVIMAHNKAYQVHMCDYYSSTPDVVPSGVSERKISPSHTCDMMTLDVITIKDSGKSLFTSQINHIIASTHEVCLTKAPIVSDSVSMSLYQNYI